MRYAVISDAHANPLALEAALADARKRRCDRFVFLGDVTGYGYDVRTTVRLVRENFDVVLMGNHDSACVGLESLLEVHLNKNYHVDLMHRDELDGEDIEWLKSLPRVHSEADAAFVHGDFTCPEAWLYITTYQDAAHNLSSRSESVLFSGHTHRALALECSEDGGARLRYPSHSGNDAVTKTIPIKNECRYVVNVGSVGYPRADRCSTYVIYDAEARRLTFRRIPIDIPAYAEKLVGHGINLPLWLSDALKQNARD